MKKTITVFCLMICIITFAQTEYQFKSTSQYFNSNEYTIQFAAQNLDGPTYTYTSRPRRALDYDDEDEPGLNPGYNPGDPGTPIGDPDFIFILLILLSYFGVIRKKGAIFFII